MIGLIWADQVRTVFITKNETLFCSPLYIGSEANRLFRSLASKNYFTECSREKLISESAELFAELNLIHPFREGNGRSQRIIFEHLCINHF